MFTYNQTDELAEMLFERYFIEYLQSKNINALMGSGPNVLMEFKSGLLKAAARGDIPASFSYDNANNYTEIQKQNLFKLPSNLMMLADTMILNLGHDATQHQFRLHENSLQNALRYLCPIFPFC